MRPSDGVNKGCKEVGPGGLLPSQAREAMWTHVTA